MSAGGARSATAAGRGVWIVAAGGVLSTVALAWSTVTSAPSTSPVAVGSLISLMVSLLAFILSGALIVSRQPRNVIGWLLLIPGLTASISQLTTNALASLDPPPDAITPALWLVLWTLSWSWVLLIVPIFHLLLVFPTGRLLSPRWRWAVALEGIIVATMMLVAAFVDSLGVLVDEEIVWRLPNPIGTLPLDFFDTSVGPLWNLLLLSITVLSVSAVVVRFRRGSRDERQQLKWTLLAVVLFGVAYGLLAIGFGSGGDELAGVLFAIGLAAIPISVAIAVLRYRLYEIDRIVSRTIGWAIVTGMLVAVFAGLIVALQTVLAPVTNENTLAVAASTLVAFALFQPLRRRVQRAVDQRFDRARYDGQQTVDRFAVLLRDEVNLDAIGSATVRAVADTVQPDRTALWVRERPREPRSADQASTPIPA